MENEVLSQNKNMQHDGTSSLSECTMPKAEVDEKKLSDNASKEEKKQGQHKESSIKRETQSDG